MICFLIERHYHVYIKTSLKQKHLHCGRQTSDSPQTCSEMSYIKFSFEKRIFIHFIKKSTNTILEPTVIKAYPVVTGLSARVQLLYKVPQIVIIVEVEQWHQLLKKTRWCTFIEMYVKNDRKRTKQLRSHLTEADSTDAVTDFVQRGRPTHDAHHVRNHQQNCTRHAWLCR